MNISDTALQAYCQTLKKMSFLKFVILKDNKILGSKFDKCIIWLYLSSPTVILVFAIISSYILKNMKIFSNPLGLLMLSIIFYIYIWCIDRQVLEQDGPMYNLEIIWQFKNKKTKFSFWTWIIFFFLMIFLVSESYSKYIEDLIIIVYSFFFWKIEVAIDESKNKKAKIIFDYIQNYDFIDADKLKTQLENEYTKDMQIYILLKLCIYYGGETYKNILLGSDKYRHIIYKIEKYLYI